MNNGLSVGSFNKTSGQSFVDDAARNRAALSKVFPNSPDLVEEFCNNKYTEADVAIAQMVKLNLDITSAMELPRHQGLDRLVKTFASATSGAQAAKADSKLEQSLRYQAELAKQTTLWLSMVNGVSTKPIDNLELPATAATRRTEGVQTRSNAVPFKELEANYRQAYGKEFNTYYKLGDMKQQYERLKTASTTPAPVPRGFDQQAYERQGPSNNKAAYLVKTLGPGGLSTDEARFMVSELVRMGDVFALNDLAFYLVDGKLKPDSAARAYLTNDPAFRDILKYQADLYGKTRAWF